MSIYMEDLHIDPINNENDLMAEAVLIYDFHDRIADFSDEIAGQKLCDASTGIVNKERGYALMIEVFVWMEDNYEGCEDIHALSNRLRTTGILSEVK